MKKVRSIHLDTADGISVARIKNPPAYLTPPQAWVFDDRVFVLASTHEYQTAGDGPALCAVYREVFAHFQVSVQQNADAA